MHHLGHAGELAEAPDHHRNRQTSRHQPEQSDSDPHHPHRIDGAGSVIDGATVGGQMVLGNVLDPSLQSLDGLGHLICLSIELGHELIARLRPAFHIERGHLAADIPIARQSRLHHLDARSQLGILHDRGQTAHLVQGFIQGLGLLFSLAQAVVQAVLAASGGNIREELLDLHHLDPGVGGQSQQRQGLRLDGATGLARTTDALTHGARGDHSAHRGHQQSQHQHSQNEQQFLFDSPQHVRTPFQSSPTGSNACSYIRMPISFAVCLSQTSYPSVGKLYPFGIRGIKFHQPMRLIGRAGT